MLLAVFLVANSASVGLAILVRVALLATNHVVRTLVVSLTIPVDVPLVILLHLLLRHREVALTLLVPRTVVIACH